MTSDVEREAVLWQNEMLRERYYSSKYPGLFQKLRRCCICLGNFCIEQALCRAEFEEWTQQRWDRAVEAELDRRDPHRGPYVLVGEDGSQTPCTHDGKVL